MLEDQPTLIGRRLKRVFGEGELQTMALQNVSLELHRGEIALLMGPSGSGKSTLLAVLSGLLRPDAGEVVTLCQDLWSLTEAAREAFRLRHMGFVFQGYNLFPALTACQQLELVLRWGMGMTGRQARRQARTMLDSLGMNKKAHLRPDQLSGGEKQRVALGRALVKQPDFCFADEPTSALDWSHGQHVVELLRSAAHDKGATVLVVSHDPRLVPYMDHVFHLNDGRLTTPVPTEPMQVYT